MTKFPFLLMDFETFSTVDIGKCGSYRYMDDPSFEPLLLSYAMNDDPVKLVDFTHDEDWPEEFLAALHDPAITKIAWNCAFERNVIYTALGKYTPPEQWLDVMHVAAQCGLPMSLDAAGKALGLPEEQAKMKEGKTLIRYFCCPCKPTKTNGGRERNFPEHAPERWKTFCDYCTRDTEAERTIFHMLEQWLPNEDERRFWALDQRINEKGVRIDRQLAINAVAMDERYKEELTAKAVALTGLENPKSVSQVKNWLADQEGKSFPSLNKKVIADVVSQLQSEDAREFMALRGELSKSSTAKYQAMLRSMCSDGHSKGCFQFYGANRTGRFCLTGDHEVLTPSGWAPLNMWQGGPIAVWSPTSRAISFQNSRAVSFPYDGEMISISQQRCDQLSTPEHKMPILSRAGVWEGREVQDVFGKCFHIPFTGVRGVSAPGDHIALRVLIMVQADGHFSVGGDLKLGFKKLRKVERCKTLLRRAEIPFMLREFQNGVQQFTIRRQDQPLWLRSFRDKTFGWWLLDEDGRTIVDELEYWDSHRCGPNSIQYCTTNRQNAEVLQAVCALNGYSATLLTKVRDGNTPNWNDAYTLNIWLTPGDSTIIRSNHQTKVHFSGTVYCAVTPTGYFLTRRNGKYWITGNSGKLVQFQNMSKNYSPSLAGMRELVRGGHYSALNALYDSVSGVLSELVRTAIIPEEGQRIVVADFSAIEARVTAWFAGEEWRLQTFRDGGDIYCASASQMFHVPVVKHGINGELRQKGKVAELALGYGGGVNALKAFGADKMGMSDEEMQETVDLWRESSPKIVELWRALEKAAIRCVVRRAPAVSTIGNVRFDFESGILWMTLPSGRRLAYYGAKYEETKFHPDRKSLTYMGVNQMTKRWERVETWGGKLTENCWAAGTPVLTARGWTPIEDVTADDLVWDGVEWVENDGSECQRSEKILCRLDGLLVTEDHKILTTEGWKDAKDCDGLERLPIQLPEGYRTGGDPRLTRTEKVARAMRLRRDEGNGHSRPSSTAETRAGGVLRMQEGRADLTSPAKTRDDKAPRLRRVALNDSAVHRADASSVEELRGPRYHGLREMAARLRRLLERHGADVSARAGHRPEGKRKGLLPGELPLGNAQSKLSKQTEHSNDNVPWADSDGEKSLGAIGHQIHHAPVPAEPRLSVRATTRRAGHGTPVYDVMNCGPRHRYVVLGETGPIIAHNCVQATARDVLREAMFSLTEKGWDIRAHVHDECICTEPIGGKTVEQMCEAMCPDIPWAKGLPLNADGYDGPYYFKD